MKSFKLQFALAPPDIAAQLVFVIWALCLAPLFDRCFACKAKLCAMHIYYVHTRYASEIRENE